jgi:DNA polymerase (family X)
MAMNEMVAAKLDAIAQMMEVLGEDSFRSAANARGARAVSALAEDVAELAKNKSDLLAIEGIGPKLADKIIECCTTGTMREYDELAARVPTGVLEVLGLNGVGPKTARAMWQQLGVDSVAKLEAAIANGTLLQLPRMGEKAVAKIKDAILLRAQSAGRIPLGIAWTHAQAMATYLRALPGVLHVEPAGSLRRGKETVGDLDIVLALTPGQEHAADGVMERFRAAPGVVKVLVSGQTKSSVILSLDGQYAPDQASPDADPPTPPPHDAESIGRGVQCDVRVVPASSFGSALQYFTGSKEHNERLRAIAQKQGLTLNEWGLFEDAAWRAYHDGAKSKASKGTARSEHQTMPASLAGATEASLYERLGVVCVPAPMREDRGEFDLTTLPDVVTIEAIRSELHAHTTASDGELSIEQLARAAHQRGFHTIAVTDHSQSSTIAGGLKPDRLREHVRAVRSVHAKLHQELGISVLAGSEVDILSDGVLDYKDEVLDLLDVVVASPHAALTQDTATATKRLLKAIAHPSVRILGHPTGRLISRRRGLEPAMSEIYAAAKEHDVALEINSHWMRLDLRDTHVRGAVDAGCLIAIDCDVHALGDFENLRFGVMTAQRGWLTKQLCVNCWPAEALRRWLSRAAR